MVQVILERELNEAVLRRASRCIINQGDCEE